MTAGADAQQFSTPTIPGTQPVPQEVFQAKMQHADALRAQMFRAQQEQGAPQGFAEKAFQAQQAYLAEQAYREYLAYQKKIQASGAPANHAGAYQAPRRLPRPQSSAPVAHAPAAPPASYQPPRSFQQSTSYQSPATNQGQQQPSNVADSSRRPSTFAPPVHVKPGSYNFGDNVKPNPPVQPQVRAAESWNSQHQISSRQPSFVAEPKKSVDLQDRISGFLSKPKYANQNQASAASSTRVAVYAPAKGPARGPIRGSVQGRSSLQGNQRVQDTQFQTRAARGNQPPASQFQVARQAPKAHRSSVVNHSDRNGQTRRQVASLQNSTEQRPVRRVPTPATRVQPAVDVSTRTKSRIAEPTPAVQQVAMVAPAQDPFNERSMTLPRTTTRPSFRSPRVNFAPSKPEQQVSVLSKDSIGGLPQELNKPLTTPVQAEPESFSGGSIDSNAIAREGVSPPPSQNELQFGNATPLRSEPATTIQESATIPSDGFPADTALESAAPSESFTAPIVDETPDRTGVELEPRSNSLRVEKTANPTIQDNDFQGAPVQDNTFRANELPSPVQDEFTGPVTKTCDDFRETLLSGSIRDIALDISPPASANRGKFPAQSREWTDRKGNVIATGAMVDLRRGYVIIENELGRDRIAYAKLSPADWAAVAEYWQIPMPCGVEIAGAIEPRNWAPQTFTWKASALCHKPLVFENIQLERYGHTHGPFSQPFHSVGHFFGRLITWPYQTAIHPPNECQYALGFYRPGDCAPWLKDPIPLTLDGIGRQAIVTGAFFAIP